MVSEIDAAVVSLPFREGQPVTRGTLIAQLDDSQLKAEVDRSEALRDQARATYERVKQVVDQNAGSAQDLDDAGARSRWPRPISRWPRRGCRRRASSRRSTAWSDRKRVSPGAFLRAGSAITDLAQIFELKVIFSAPERYLSKLSRGSEVTVSTTAYPGYTLQGKIDVIDPVLDPATRSAQVIARVRNPGGKFRPGMSANVSAVLSQRTNALTIPSEAVFAEGNQTFVYVVKPDSTVDRTAVTLGTRLSDAVEVVDGLQPGARVVRAGHQKLFPRAKVIPIESAAAGGAGASGAAGGTAGGGAAAGDAPGKAAAAPKAGSAEKKDAK